MRTTGILTFAIGKAYARHAYALYLSAKLKGVQTWIVADPEAHAWLKDHEAQGGGIPALEEGRHPFWIEQYALDYTPFDITLKMDADCLIPDGADMDRVWAEIDYHQLVTGVPHTLDHKPVHSTAYREIEKAMGLPTVYSTMFGFTKSSHSLLFYQHMKLIAHHWGTDQLPMTKDMVMTTDTLYSMAWAACHNPSAVLFGMPFHHMKPQTLGWGDKVREDWTREVPYSIDGNKVSVAGQAVMLPMHYQDKNFLSDTAIRRMQEMLCM